MKAKKKNAPAVTHRPAAEHETVGRASWEEPALPFRERFHKTWRQMLVHLWGPAGSVVFHLVAIGLLITLLVGPHEKTEKAPTFIPLAQRTEPTILDEKAPIPGNDQEPSPTQCGTVVPKGDSGTALAAGLIDGPAPEVSPLVPDRPATEDGMPLPAADAGLPILSGRTPSALIPTYGCRTPQGRGMALAPYAKGPGIPGAEMTERAVTNALRWLKREQQPAGCWAGVSPPAMTALALLTYLAHDEKPDSKEFGPTVRRALEWLIADQEPDGHFKGRDSNDYTQPIAADALCEAYGMTQHPGVRSAAIKAVTLVVQGQKAAGTFNYKLETASARNDTSYMAWCCQALKAAKMARLEADVPGLDMAIKKAAAGMKLNADPQGGFGYVSRGHTGLSGAGAFCLQMLGYAHAAEVKATLTFLAPASFSFAAWDRQPYDSNTSPLYYWYYMTQAKFQDGKETFASWNAQFSPELCRRQIVDQAAIQAPDGRNVDVGHWESPTPKEHTGGVVQDTCLCTLMLEVYYRYLPSTREFETEPDARIAAPKAGDIAVKIH